VNYSVEWSDIADNALIEIWLLTPDRNAVTRACHEIESSLAATPYATGTIVFDTVREYIRAPLGVEFEIIDADRCCSF
jgi:hypothetical protein